MQYLGFRPLCGEAVFNESTERAFTCWGGFVFVPYAGKLFSIPGPYAQTQRSSQEVFVPYTGKLFSIPGPYAQTQRSSQEVFVPYTGKLFSMTSPTASASVYDPLMGFRPLYGEAVFNGRRKVRNITAYVMRFSSPIRGSCFQYAVHLIRSSRWNVLFSSPIRGSCFQFSLAYLATPYQCRGFSSPIRGSCFQLL